MSYFTGCLLALVFIKGLYLVFISIYIYMCLKRGLCVYLEYIYTHTHSHIHFIIHGIYYVIHLYILRYNKVYYVYVCIYVHIYIHALYKK